VAHASPREQESAPRRTSLLLRTNPDRAAQEFETLASPDGSGRLRTDRRRSCASSKPALGAGWI
jgi:hypothetical protein